VAIILQTLLLVRLCQEGLVLRRSAELMCGSAILIYCYISISLPNLVSGPFCIVLYCDAICSFLLVTLDF
jgi:hypothetical protein